MDHKLQIILAAKDATKSAFLSAQGQVKAFTKSVFSLRGAMVATAGAAAMGAMIKKSLETADAIGKASDVIGISTDALQEYRHAARLAGVSTSLMDNSFKAFSKRVGEARNETGALVTFLNKFDEQLLKNIQTSGSTEEALDLLMDRLGRTASQTDRAALAAAAFSRSGLVLTNMVKDGAAGLAKMRQEARDLGIVMDEQFIRQSEKANDEIEKLTRVIKVQFMSAAVGLAPEIAKLAENTTNWWKANQDLVKTEVAGYLNKTKDAILAIKGIYDSLPEGIGGPAGVGLVVGIIGRSGPIGATAAAIAYIATHLDDLKLSLDNIEKLERKGMVPFPLISAYKDLKKLTDQLYDYVKVSEKLPIYSGKIGPETTGYDIYKPPVGDGSGRDGAGAAERGKELSTELKQYYGWWSAYGDTMNEFYTTNSKVYLDTVKSDIEKSKEAYAAMYGDLRFQSEEYFDYRATQLADQAALYAEHTGDEALAYEWLTQRIKELDQERIDSTAKTYGILEEMSLRTSDAMEQAFSDFFFDVFMNDLKTSQDYIRALGRTTARILADVTGQMVKDWLLGWVTKKTAMVAESAQVQMLTALYYQLAAAKAAAGGMGGGYNAADWAGTLWHKGGTVGTDTAPTRIVPASLFAHAPRLHQGLAPDEFPAILQRGETVIPKGQSVSQVKNLTVNSYLTVEGDMDRRAASLHLADVEEKVRSVLREEMS